MAETGVGVNVTRDSLGPCDITLLVWAAFGFPVVALAWSIYYFENKFEGVVATLGIATDSAANTDSEMEQIEAGVEAEGEAQAQVQIIPAQEPAWINPAVGRIICLQFWGMEYPIDGFLIEVGGLAEWFQTNGMHRREQDIMFIDRRFDSRPMSISYAGRYQIRGTYPMDEVYLQLKIMSVSAINQYEKEEEAFYKRIFEQSVDVADNASLAEVGENKCSICLEAFEVSPCGKPVSETHLAIEVKCGQRHVFGASCIWEWVRGCRDSARDRGCPMCCNKLEIPNSGWDADLNWVRIHLEQRPYYKQRRRENVDHLHYVRDHRRHLTYKIPMPKQEWINFLVDTIAALEIPESDEDIVEALKDAKALLRAFSSLADRLRWPRGVDRKSVVSFTGSRDHDVHTVQALKSAFNLFDLQCGTIENLSIMARELFPYRELYWLDQPQPPSSIEATSKKTARRASL